MTPKRPAFVTADATLIYPGQSFGPGVGVQAATLRAIAAQIEQINSRAELNYARGMQDWNTNKAIDEAYGLPVPPAPAAPHLIKLTVVYADVNGTVITDPAITSSGLEYAWVEEKYA